MKQLRIILCGNTAFNANPLGAKPLAVELSKHVDVIYVEPPVSHLTKYRNKDATNNFSDRQISDCLSVVVPVVFPGKDRKGINKLTSFLLNKKLKRLTKDNAYNVCITTAPHYKITPKPFNQLIYWMMDDYLSQPGLIGVEEKTVRDGVSHSLKNSHAVIVVSNFLRNKLRELGVDSHVVHNGADADLFRFQPERFADELKLPTEPFAVYVGGLNARVDIDYLLACAKNDIELVIAGKQSDTGIVETLKKYTNVTFIGNVTHEEIPKLLSRARVGLVPYADSEFNRASFPLKISEYLINGLDVVSTDLDFVDEFGDLVYRAADPKVFAKTVKEVVAQPEKNRRQKSEEASQLFSLEKQALEILELIKENQ